VQCLSRAVEVAVININMTFNTRKTVCVVFNSSDGCKIVAVKIVIKLSLSLRLSLHCVIVHCCLLIGPKF